MRPERRAVAACALALFAARSCRRYPLARTWYALGVLDQHDVLFDADPVVFLQAFGDGDMRDRLWRAHPNVRNLVNPPVRRPPASPGLVRPDWTPARARPRLPSWWRPAAAASTTAAVFLTLRRARGIALAAVLAALLEAFAFSGLVFGSIPESYPLSGAMLAAAFLLLAEAVRRAAGVSGSCRGSWWPRPLSGSRPRTWCLVGIPLFFAARADPWLPAAGRRRHRGRAR